MSRGLSIIVTADPKGNRLEGIVSGTPFPGYGLELVPSTAPVSGRHTWRARSAATGTKGPQVILLEDDLQGFMGVGAARSFPADATGGPSTPGSPGTAYVSGSRCFMYAPEALDEMNLYIKDKAGTADDVNIGDLYAAGLDGTFYANSAYASAPWQSMEQILNPNADYLLWLQYLGNQA